MNPMQLLTASNSLMEVGEATCRYRMAEGNLLPKFNSASRAAPGTAAEPVTPATRPPVEGHPPAAPRGLPTKSSVRPPPIQARERISGRERSWATIRAGASPAVRQALDKVNPLSYWKRRKLQATSEKIKTAKPALQGELSLDRVKVVRNDLCDTDLEIVPMANVEQPKIPERVPGMVHEREPTGAAWGRLSSRSLGAGQTPI